MNLLCLLLSLFVAPGSTDDHAGRLKNAFEDSLAGFWQGQLSANGEITSISLDVQRDSVGQAIGHMTARSLAFVRAPLLSPIKMTDSVVQFSAGLSEGALRFRGVLRNSEIHGSVIEIGIVNGGWAAVGDTIPFTLKRSTTSVMSEGYVTRDTTVRNGDITLSATLFLPTGRSAAPRPAVVFVHGSGAALRDEGNVIADHFARRGFIALTYDKRGVGRSTGDWTTATVPDLADDALAGLKFLSGLNNVDRNRIGLAGMSQGGWVVVSAAGRSPLVKFLIAQAGPVLPPRINDAWRFKLRLGEAGIGGSDSVRALAFLDRDAEVSSTGRGLEQLKHDVELVKDSAWFKALGWSPSDLDSEYRRWSARIDSYDPSEDLAAITAPALWIYGNADKAVDGRTEAAAACASRTASHNRSVLILDRADHGMRIDQPRSRIFPHLHPQFLPALDKWLDASVIATGKKNAAGSTCPILLR
jgi:pimeloyl-ACP methyl ester carboxylesterase